MPDLRRQGSEEVAVQLRGQGLDGLAGFDQVAEQLDAALQVPCQDPERDQGEMAAVDHPGEDRADILPAGRSTRPGWSRRRAPPPGSRRRLAGATLTREAYSGFVTLRRRPSSSQSLAGLLQRPLQVREALGALVLQVLSLLAPEIALQPVELQAGAAAPGAEARSRRPARASIF